MIRKLRTERDNQQWMLDLALNMRGRVQNFERDDLEVPAGKRARNYRMLPKVWREAAERNETARAARARRRARNATATFHYDHAIEAYRMAQHPIFFDNHPVKKALYRKLNEMVDRRSDGRGLSDRARRGAVRRRQNDFVPLSPAAGPAQGAGGDLRAGHGPDQGSVSEGEPQHRAVARLSRAGDRRPRPGQFQHPENPLGRRQLRARRRGGDQLSDEAAGSRQEEDRDLRHQHGQLLVAAALELRPSRGGGREFGRVLQPEQHDLHAVLPALQADVHVHGRLRQRGKIRRRSRQGHDRARLSRQDQVPDAAW